MLKNNPRVYVLYIERIIKQVISKWKPAKFDKKCKEIHKKIKWFIQFVKWGMNCFKVLWISLRSFDNSGQTRFIFFFDSFFFCKGLVKPISINDSFNGIAGQGVLHFDWNKYTTGYNQPKKVAKGTTFPWWLTPCKNN